MKLNVRQAARLLSVPESEVYRWVEEGEIPCVLVKNQPLFGRAELLEWATARGMVTAVDAFPPTVFFADLPVAWVPTIELTTHVRARPAPGWLACAFTTRFITGGFLEEDGEVWDSTGRLVAQSRQLALLHRG